MMNGLKKAASLNSRPLVMLVFGLIAIVTAIAIQEARLPEAAPADVESRGYDKLRAILEHVSASDFGRRERGATLTAAIESLMASHRIRFSAEMGGPRAQLYSRPLRRPVLYIRIMQVGPDTWLHQLPLQLAEAVYHEAVHVVQGGWRQACFEEECDAFLAGLYANAVIQAIRVPEQPTIDGMTVAAFVRETYPGARRNPRYNPVGKDRDWLMKRAGIDEISARQ